MIIYWSMLLWVPFVYIIYSAVRKRKENKVVVPGLAGTTPESSESEKIPLFFAVFTFAYLTFWIGMRGHVMDTSMYIISFESISSDFSTAWSEIDWEGKGIGFDIFSILFKCFVSQDYQWWLMTIAIISLVCIMLPLRKYSCEFFFSVFIFVALNTYTWAMNGIRQFICVAILFACCGLIKDNKFIKFALIVLLLSTVHYTALLMIPIYFVAKSKPWQLRVFIFILAIALVCVFAEPLFAELEDTVLSGTAYSNVTSQFEGDDGVNPLRALFFSVFPILAFVRRKSLQEQYENHPMLPIAINMSLVSATLFFVGVFTSGILIGRLPVYCSVYNMLLIPYILKYGFNDKDRTLARMAIVIMMMVMFWMEVPEIYHSELTGWVK